MSIKIEGFPPSTAGITGALVYRGELDPTSPPADITSASKGDFYVVSADGTLATVALNTNDHIIFNRDASNPLTAAMFDKIDNTEPTASETVAGIIEIATDLEAAAAAVNNKALVPSNIGSINTSDLNNDAGFITSGLQSGDNVSELVNDAGYLTSVASASETTEGIIETATDLEAAAAAVNNKALVPSNIGSINTSDLNNDAGFLTTAVQSGDNVSVLVNDAGYLTSVASASETTEGIIETATDLEAAAGSANNKALVPSNISSITLNQLDEVSYTAGSSINNYVLTYIDANGQWEAKAATGGGGGSVPDVVTDSTGTDTTISTSTGIEEVHLISNGSNAVIITIPSASTSGEGYKYQIKRLGTANVTVTTATPSTDGQIDNSDTFVLTSQYQSVTVVSDASDYFII